MLELILILAALLATGCSQSQVELPRGWRKEEAAASGDVGAMARFSAEAERGVDLGMFRRILASVRLEAEAAPSP